MIKKHWFKSFGWIYYPVSWQGFLVTMCAIIFCVQVFVAVDKKSHSVSDTLYGIFPFWMPTIGAYLWIGLKTSGSKQ